jgi:hypothetical protein
LNFAGSCISSSQAFGFFPSGVKSFDQISS